MSVTTGPGTFQAALARLGDLHRQELEQIRQEYEHQLDSLSRENISLRNRLGGKETISPADIEIEAVKDPTQSDARSSNHNGSTHDEQKESLALVPYVRVMSASSGWEPLEPSRIHSVRDDWLKSMDSRHWGANLDVFMYSSNLKSQRKSLVGDSHDHAHKKSFLPGVIMRSRALFQRAQVANAAAQSLEDGEQACIVPPPDLEDNHGCTIYPNSTFRLSWDLTGLVLIGYDLITIPFTLAFNPEPFWFLIGMDWITLLFWTGDMMQGFFLGYFDKGQYVSDNRTILRHYMMTWFVPDAVVVVPDWLLTVSNLAASSATTSSDDAQASEMFKFLKGARAVRVLRLLRLLKLQRIINLLYDMIESEHTFICVNLAKLLLAVLVLNHVIACIWFLIGRVCMDNGMRNWIQVGGVEDESIPYKYSTSMHWSLTQFTPASMDISARNVPERFFSIVVLFFSVVAFSSIVASITGAMTSLRNMRAEEMKQFWLLRRYLRQREVTSDLNSRIFKYLEHQTAKQSKLVQTNSLKATFSKLSLALQSELTHTLNSRFLTRHPFFNYLDDSMSVVMHRLCHQCLGAQSHAEKEVIFSAGDKATKVLFIKGGMLDYTMVDGSRLDPVPGSEDWVGEAVLWTEWRHTGRLQSVTASDLITVEPRQFVDIMCIHPRSWVYAKRYAAKFVDFINSLDPRDAIDIIRDLDWYNEVVKGCDACTDPANVDDIILNRGTEEGDGSRDLGEAPPSPAWTNGSPDPQLVAGRAGSSPKRHSVLGRFCPWAATSACEPWCGPGAQRRRR